MFTLVAIILVLVILNALYVAAEFATVSVRAIRIQALAEGGNKTAQRLLPHLTDAASLDRYVAACQIGITASSLLLGAFGQAKLAAFIEPWLVGLAIVEVETAASITATTILILLTAFQVVLGELLPKSIALRFPEKVSLTLVYPMLASLWLYSWFIKVLNGTGTWFLTLLKVPVGGHRHIHSPEELEQLVNHGAEAGAFDEGEYKLLTRVFRFQDHTALDLMVPRLEVVGIDLASPLEESLQIMEDSGHTRFPLMDGDLDRIEGYVHLKEVTTALAGGTLTDLRQLLRPAIFAPSSLGVAALFETMRRKRGHLVFLLDEFGGTKGIVTMEDVLRQIVGEIQDEFGGREREVLRRDGAELVVGGQMLLNHLIEELGVPFQEAPTNTVGGLVLHVLGRPAEVGENVIFEKLKFTVLETRGKRVVKVRVSHV